MCFHNPTLLLASQHKFSVLLYEKDTNYFRHFLGFFTLNGAPFGFSCGASGGYYPAMRITVLTSRSHAQVSRLLELFPGPPRHPSRHDLKAFRAAAASVSHLGKAVLGNGGLTPHPRSPPGEGFPVGLRPPCSGKNLLSFGGTRLRPALGSPQSLTSAGRPEPCSPSVPTRVCPLGHVCSAPPPSLQEPPFQWGCGSLMLALKPLGHNLKLLSSGSVKPVFGEGLTDKWARGYAEKATVSAHGSHPECSVVSK